MDCVNNGELKGGEKSPLFLICMLTKSTKSSNLYSTKGGGNAAERGHYNDK